MTGTFKGHVDRLLSVAVPTFGERIEYRPLSGGRYNLTAVYDQEFTQIDPDTETVISVNKPHVGLKLKDIPGEPMQGDEVKADGTLYKVNEIQEDGQGGVVLWLTKLDEQEA